MGRACLMALLVAGCGKDLEQLAPFPCATNLTCPAAYLCVDLTACQVWETCQLVAARKTCTNAARPRCVMLQTPEGPYTTDCVYDNQSTAHEGDFCGSFATSDFTAIADCPNGMICYNPANYGGASEPNYCRLYCASDADCGNGSSCAFAFTGTAFSAVSSSGVCQPSCGPFGSPCSATDFHCDAMTRITGSGGLFTCRTNGPGAQGADCTSQNCQAGLICVPLIGGVQSVPTCRVPCDGSHLCASGTCNTGSFPLPGAIGFCQ